MHSPNHGPDMTHPLSKRKTSGAIFASRAGCKFIFV